MSCADRPTGAVPRDERGFVQDGESYAPRMTWANVSSVAVLVPVGSAVRHNPDAGALRSCVARRLVVARAPALRR